MPEKLKVGSPEAEELFKRYKCGRGKVWPDHCGHEPEHFVCSYFYHEKGGYQFFDLYVFDTGEKRDTGVCIRFGPEPWEHFGTDIRALLFHDIPEYREACRCLFSGVERHYVVKLQKTK